MISIIDDDASVRAAVGNLLQSLGYIAQAFESAEEFLRSDYMDRTACVIADVHMPVMSGVELLALLRDQDRRVPFIFITAFPDERIRARAFSAGALGFLTKPFDQNHLIECLEQALRLDDGNSGR
jgi:FixJ family two-component response regulator